MTYALRACKSTTAMPDQFCRKTVAAAWLPKTFFIAGQNGLCIYISKQDHPESQAEKRVRKSWVDAQVGKTWHNTTVFSKMLWQKDVKGTSERLWDCLPDSETMSQQECAMQPCMIRNHIWSCWRHAFPAANAWPQQDQTQRTNHDNHDKVLVFVKTVQQLNASKRTFQEVTPGQPGITRLHILLESVVFLLVPGLVILR